MQCNNYIVVLLWALVSETTAEMPKDPGELS